MLEREILGRNAEADGIESAGLIPPKIIFTIDRGRLCDSYARDRNRRRQTRQFD